MSEKRKDFFSLNPETFLERISAPDVSKVSIPEQSFEKEIALIEVSPVLGRLMSVTDKTGKPVSASSKPAQTIMSNDGYYYISLKNDLGEYAWYLLK